MEKPRPLFEGVAMEQEPKNDPEKERQERVKNLLQLVEKINESGEVLPFPGIHPEALSKMKADDAEFPGFTTPIEEIIERCTQEGIKVVVGKKPESGNIFILPAGSNDIEMDSIAPHQLEIGAVGNEHLAELIRLTPKTR